MSLPVTPTCPVDCSSIALSPSFSECAPETNVGEITKLYLQALDGACFDDVEDLAEWTADLASGDVVEFTVWGEMPEGEETEIPISGDRIAKGRTTFVLNLEVDETNNTNYEIARTLSGCTVKYNVWWETAGGKIYGGDCGVEATVMAKFITPKERTEIEKILINVKWRDRFLPERADSPMA